MGLSVSRGYTSAQIFATKNHFQPPVTDRQEFCQGAGNFSTGDYWALFVPIQDMMATFWLNTENTEFPELAIYTPPTGKDLSNCYASELLQVAYNQGSGFGVNVGILMNQDQQYVLVLRGTGQDTLHFGVDNVTLIWDYSPLLSNLNPPTIDWNTNPGYITLSTPGIADVTYWYKINDAQVWSIYTQPIQVGGLTEIWARSQKDKYYLSSVAYSANY